MNVLFHGTGSGYPSATRGASAASLLFSDSRSLLIDAGEGCSRAMLRDGLELNNVTNVVISHTHADHWTGLPNLVMGWVLHKRRTPVHLFLPPKSHELIRLALEKSWLLESRRSFELVIENLQSIDLPDRWNLRPFRTTHLDKYTHQVAQKSLPFPSYGFVVESPEKKILFSQDIASESDIASELIGADIVVCESAHVDLVQVLSLAEEASVSKVIFTHIPPYREEELRHLKKREKVDWICAEDGMVLSL